MTSRRETAALPGRRSQGPAQLASRQKLSHASRVSPRLRNPLLATILLAVGLAAGWFARGWDGFGPSHGNAGREGLGPTDEANTPPHRPASPAPKPASNSQDRELSPAMQLLKKMLVAQPGGDTSPLESFNVDQFTSYLERHKRDATSLLAVWQLTEDTAVLREAYEKFPGELPVATNALQGLSLSEEEKESLLQRMEEEHPNNALGAVLAGSQLAKEGRIEEAIAKLREAVTRPELDFETKGQLLAKREALMSIGKSSLEARLRSTFGAPPFDDFQQLTRSAATQIKSLLAANDTDAALSLSGDVMALGRRLAQEPSKTIFNELVAKSIEASALRTLPPDVEIGDTGRAATEQLAYLKAQHMWDQAGLEWHLSHLDEPGVELYFQIVEQRGEREALRWAESYNGPAPKPEPATK